MLRADGSKHHKELLARLNGIGAIRPRADCLKPADGAYRLSPLLFPATSFTGMTTENAARQRNVHHIGGFSTQLIPSRPTSITLALVLPPEGHGDSRPSHHAEEEAVPDDARAWLTRN